MGQRVPGRQSGPPPYSRAFTTAQADLTSFVVSAPAAGQQQVAPYQLAASGAVLIVTAATPTFAYVNCANETVTVPLGTNVVGNTIDLPVAMIGITTITGLTAIVYWHGSTLP